MTLFPRRAVARNVRAATVVPGLMVLVQLAMPGAASGAETDWQVFAPPLATHGEYHVTVEDLGGDGRAVLSEYRLDVLRASDGGSGVIAIVIHRAPLPSGTLPVTSHAPVLFLSVDGHGNVRPATAPVLLRDALLRNFLWDELAFVPGTELLEVGHEWAAKERSKDGVFFSAFDVRHRIEAVGAQLRVRSSVPEGLELQGGSGRRERRSTIERWERAVVIDPADRSIVSVQLDLRAEVSWRSQPTARRYRLVRRNQRPLSEDEVATLEGEITLLMGVEKAVQDQRLGHQPPGILGSLFGGARKPARDPLKFLDSYQAKYPDGLLSAVSTPLRASVQSHLERFRRERREQNRGAELVGETAPDFTLKDMEGRDVALKEFRGKVVLLTFWGYG